MLVNSTLLFAFSLFLTLFFPALRLLFFAPYLVLACYKFPLSALLWRAALCGLVVDLFSSSPFFGESVIHLTLVSFLISRQKTHFFADKWSTMPIMTFLFSLFYSAIHPLFGLLYGLPFSFSFRLFFGDFVLFPLIDALYGAALLFVCFQFRIQFNKMKMREEEEE